MGEPVIEESNGFNNHENNESGLNVEEMRRYNTTGNIINLPFKVQGIYEIEVPRRGFHTVADLSPAITFCPGCGKL